MEDNRRTATAIFLCIVIVLVWTQYIQVTQYPATQHPSPQSGQAGDLMPMQQQVVGEQSPTVAATASAPADSSSAQQHVRASLDVIEKSGFITVETTLYTAQISRLGGRIYSLSLKAYKKHLKGEDALELVSRRDGTPLPLGVYSSQYNDELVMYAPRSAGSALSDSRIRASSGGEARLDLTGVFPDGTPLTKSLVFRDDSFLIPVSLNYAGNQATALWLEWTSYSGAQRLADRIDPEQFTVLKADGKLETLAVASHRGMREMDSAQWASFGDKYFMAALIPPAQSQRLTRVGGSDAAQASLPGAAAVSGAEKGASFSLLVSGTNTGGEFSLYAGPKDYRILRHAGNDLFRGIDLGKLSFISYPLLRLVSFFHSLLGNYGLAIILLTLVIKALFLPLTKASFKSMKAMQNIQPEMKALRERVKDPTQLNQEMAALFKKNGVNPMGGCLPILVQLPVWLGLYWALSLSIELRHAPFALWITDLSAPEHLEIFGIGVPVMVLLMGLSMFLQQLSMPNTAADPTQQKVMMFTPVIFTLMFIIFPMPSGLVLYWLTSNVISITQQEFLRRSGRISPELATLIASTGIFAFGYILTLV